MYRVVQDYLDNLEQAANKQQLCDALKNVAAGFDLNSVAYLAMPTMAGRQPRLITNYPEAWKRHYQAQRYDTCDPVVLRSHRDPRNPSNGGRSLATTALSHAVSSMKRPSSAFVMASPFRSDTGMAAWQPSPLQRTIVALPFAIVFAGTDWPWSSPRGRSTCRSATSLIPGIRRRRTADRARAPMSDLGSTGQILRRYRANTRYKAQNRQVSPRQCEDQVRRAHDPRGRDAVRRLQSRNLTGLRPSPFGQGRSRTN